jgi:hypothetical protein
MLVKFEAFDVGVFFGDFFKIFSKHRKMNRQ